MVRRTRPGTQGTQAIPKVPQVCVLVGVDGPRRHRLCQTVGYRNRSQEEPSDDDYQDRVGYVQACLSSTRRRRARATGSAPAAATQRGGKVFRQAGADADRAGGVRGLAPLGAGIARSRARGGADPTAIHQPYVKRGKNDAIDAAAICEAMSRPGMRFVPVKSTEEQA